MKEQSRTTNKGRVLCKLFTHEGVQFIYLESETNPVYFPTNYEKEKCAPINAGEWAKLNYNKVPVVSLTPALREKAIVALEERPKFLENLKKRTLVSLFQEAQP